MASNEKGKKRKQKYTALRQALEPRILFDASLAAPPHDLGIPADVSAHDPSQVDTHSDTSKTPQAPQDAPQTNAPTDNAAQAPANPAAVQVQDVSKTASDTRSGNTDNSVPAQPLAITLPPVELVFIDSRVLDPESLLKDISPTAEVHFLDAGQNGIDQIDAVIKSEHAPISAIHILSHGDSGSLELGNSTLDTQTLSDQYATKISSWQSHLTPDASVLLYGCDIAKGDLGQQFVTDLSRDMGVSVAASIDYTGSALHAGNWTLEFQTGTIGAAITDIFSSQSLANYNYLLAQPIVDLNGPTVLNITDNFASGTYTGGSSNTATTWSGGWTEFDASPNRAFMPGGSTNSDNSPTGGNVIIPSVATGGTVAGLGTGQEIAFVGHGVQFGDSIARTINLDAYTSATLSFSYRTAGLTAADAIEIDVSNNGGATYTTIGILANVTSNSTVTFDISNYISDTTTIKFAVNKGFSTASSQQFFFDNVSVVGNGNNFTSNFSEQANIPIAIVDPTMTITDPNGLQISSANVTLANMKTGDTFAIGTIPSTVTATINNVTGTVLLQSVSGLGASTADFTTALKAITFRNASATVDSSVRTINVTVTDTNSLMSAASTSYIVVSPFDNPAVTDTHSITATPLGATSGKLFDNSSLTAERTAGAIYDYDPDTAGLSTSLLTQATKGTAVVNADGSYTYTPNAGATGTDSFTYTLTSAAQVIGVNYQEWNMDTTSTSLLTSFPTGTPSATGFIKGYDVNTVAINSGNSTLDDFVVRFTNSITITTAGNYTFYSGSDDGSVLYLNGQIVVNNDGLHSYQEKSGAIALAAGVYTLQVDFMEHTGQENLNVSYLGPDTAGLKTDLSSIGSVLANTNTTGTVNITIQDNGPRLALGTSVFALDQFNSAAYNLNNGTFNFAGNWVEQAFTDNSSATAGEIKITNNATLGSLALQIQDTTNKGGIQSISRAVDMLGVSGITPTRVGTQLTFDYTVTSANTNGVQVQISPDNGTTWVTLDTLSSTTTPATGTKTYDISNYATSTTLVRFLPTVNSNTNPVYIDNFRVNASTVNYTPSNFIENGSPVSIASANTAIADPTGNNLTSAVITISNAQSGDLLSYDNFVSGITASLSGNTLTLTGTATRANYALALQHVFYSNSSDNPAIVNRTINVTVKDTGNSTSNTAVSTIGVIAVNDAPTGIPRTVSTSFNIAYILQASDFSFTDIEGNALLAVKIPTVPASVGTLQFDTTGSGNWTAVTANQIITAANITAGRLRFLPTTGSSGPGSFTFQVQDNGGTANGGADTDATARNFTINVLSGPNTAPTLTRDLTLASNAEDNLTPTPRSILQLMTDGGANAFHDPDTNASLSGLAIVGNTADSVLQGAWQYSTDGANWFSIGTVGDNASTPALALSAATQIRFVPVANYNGTPTSLVVRAMDDTYAGSFTNGATRTTLNSATNGGSTAVSGALNTLSTTVTPVNDAPILIAGNPTFNTISATSVNNAGQLVSDFVKSTSGGNWSYVTDVDAGAVQGIAIIGAANTNGTWQYSTDNGVTWSSVNAVTVNSALLLRSTDLIRFNPDGTNAGTGAITYRAWDQSSGVVGTKVDTASNGGTTPFSVLTDVASITTSSASGPVLANTSAPLNYIENAAAGAIDTALTVTDTSTSTLTSSAIWVTNFVSGQDVLSFANDGSTMGNITGSYNAATGVLTLSSSGSTATLTQWQSALHAVKYSNTSNAPDTTARTVNYQVNDSKGTPSNVLTTTLAITAVNDAPTGTDKAFTVTQSTNYTFTAADFGFSDAADNSANTLLAVQITTLPAAGTLKDNGVAVTLNSFISIADINAGKLVYTAPTTNGARTIQFKVQDNGGTANGGIDLALVANTFTFTVSGANTAPSLTVLTPTLTTITEDDVNNPGQTVASFLGTVTDPDAGALKGIAITSLGTATNGSWQYSIDGGTTWTAFPAVSASSSLLLRSTDVIRFVPNAINGGGGTLTYRAWDQTSGTYGTTVSTTTNGGATAFSTNTATATITSTAINDAPTAAMTAASYSATEQTNLTLSGTGISIADIDAGTSTVNATLSVGEGQLTVAVGTTGVTVTGSGTSSVLLSGTLTQINNLLAGLNSGSILYNDNLNAPAATTNLTLLVNDLGNTGTGGALTATVVRAINIAAVNDAPTLSTTGTVGAAYTENAAGVALVSGTITAGDVDTTNFNNGTLTAAFSSYVSGDVLSVNNQGVGAGQIGVSGSNITYGGTVIGTVSGGSGSDLVITLNSNATSTVIQALVGQLRYQSTSDDPTLGGTAGTRALTVTLNDGGNTGLGGALSTSLPGTVTITAYDDAPTVSTTPVGGLFIEGAGLATGTPVLFFSGSVVSAVENGQTIKSLGFTINNIVDATEQLSIDGTLITLTNGATGTTTTNGMTYNISLVSGTASVTLTKAAGVSSGNISTLINSLSYQNTSQDPTAGTRTLTLTQLIDSGSNTAPNVNAATFTLPIASNVTVVPVNDAPTLSATAVGGTFTEGAGLAVTGTPVSLFSGASVSTIEAGQLIKSLTFTVGNVLDSTEQVNVDGSTIALTNLATGSTTTNGMTYNVTVAGGTATIALTKAAGVSSASIGTLINWIELSKYQR